MRAGLSCRVISRADSDAGALPQARATLECHLHHPNMVVERQRYGMPACSDSQINNLIVAQRAHLSGWMQCAEAA
jgi:hypothetical protein